MGIKDWVRSRSKSRSRSSIEINNGHNNDQSNSSGGSPRVPRLSTTMRPDRTPKQSADLSRSPYATSSPAQAQPSSPYSPTDASRSSAPVQQKPLTQSGSLRARYASGAVAPGTAVTTDATELASQSQRGRSLQDSNATTGYQSTNSKLPIIPGRYRHTSPSLSSSANTDRPPVPGIDGATPIAQQFAASSYYTENGRVPPVWSQDVAHSTPSKSLRHQADVSDLNRELLEQRPEQSGTTSGLDKAVPVSGGSSGARPPRSHVNDLTNATPSKSTVQDGLYTQFPHRDTTSEVKSGLQTAYDGSRGMVVSGASRAPNLSGIVDLSNSEDTTVQVRTAPAVVHEVVLPTVHHIRHEVVTREIHTHEYFHRILPIIDVEVLPTRHFVPSRSQPGTFEELAAESLPQSTIDKYTSRNWVLAETVSKSRETPLPGRRRFTAKEFPGTEGDYLEWTGEDGIPRTKTTWVHWPVINDVLYKDGLTQPVEIP